MKEQNHANIYIYKRIVQAKVFIDRHFDTDINLDQIADEACFSKFHFIRLFRSVYGNTPHQYLTKVRIEKAGILLQNNTSVADTCYSVGFDSISSFTGLFRRLTGFSPSAYQQLYLQRLAQLKKNLCNLYPAASRKNIIAWRKAILKKCYRRLSLIFVFNK